MHHSWSAARLLILAGGLVVFVGACSALPFSSDDADAPVATFANEEITFDEVYAAWGRQPVEAVSDTTDTTAALVDFLNQYLNYRLKVHEAVEQGYADAPDFQNEVATYRRERARPALIEENVTKPLLDTLYARQQYEVHVRHMLVEVDENAPPEDTTAAYERIRDLQVQLEEGHAFSDLAREHSDDPSAQQSGQRGFEGDLGYLTAGQLVEPFEDAMYRHPVEAPPRLVRSSFGYHLVDVLDRRPRIPDMRIAYIMLFPEDPNHPASHSEAAARADSLANTLPPDSTAFADAAQRYSADEQTAANGGELGWLTIEQHVPLPFRDAVRQLDEDGAISEVVALDNTYYLIQRRAIDPLPSFEEAESELRDQLEELPRTERHKQAYVRSLHDHHAVRVDSNRVATAFDLDDWTTPAHATDRTRAQSADAHAAVYVDQDTLTAADFALHLRTHPSLRDLPFEEALNRWLDDHVLNAAADAHAESDPELQRELREFRDGALVFELMQDSVWTASTNDPATDEAADAERAFHERLRNRYNADLFPERLRRYYDAASHP